MEQLHKIFKLCGSPSDEYWKKSKLPHATIFKPQQSYRRCIAETFKEFPASSLPLIDTLLSIDPAQRLTATDALGSEVSVSCLKYVLSLNFWSIFFFYVLGYWEVLISMISLIFTLDHVLLTYSFKLLSSGLIMGRTWSHFSATDYVCTLQVKILSCLICWLFKNYRDDYRH